MKAKVLITGGAGFIGHKTANKLIEEGYSVRVFDNLSNQVHPDPKDSLSRLHSAVEFICGDVRDQAQLKAALKDIDVVYHFAAETGVGQSMYEVARYSDVTIQGTAVLCDCLAKNEGQVQKLILSSSRAVYGEGQYWCDLCEIVYPSTRSISQLKKGIWDLTCPQCGTKVIAKACKESTLRRPVSIYGLTKKVQEDLITMISKTYHIPVIILRYFNVFGDRQSAINPYTGVLSIFTSLMLSNRDIEIYEDGQMLRDFVSIQEVVNTNIKVLDLNDIDILMLNVGTGKQRTILELAKYLKCEIGSNSNISVSGRYRIGDIRHCIADMDKNIEYIGPNGNCNGSFTQAIKNMIAWIRQERQCVKLEASIDELYDLDLTGVAGS